MAEETTMHSTNHMRPGEILRPAQWVNYQDGAVVRRPGDTDSEQGIGL